MCSIRHTRIIIRDGDIPKNIDCITETCVSMIEVLKTFNLLAGLMLLRNDLLVLE